MAFVWGLTEETSRGGRTPAHRLHHAREFIPTSEQGTTLQVLQKFTLKPRPEYGLDFLKGSELARQRFEECESTLKAIQGHQRIACVTRLVL